MPMANEFLLTKDRFGADVLLNLANFALVERNGEGSKLYPLSFNERYHGPATETDIPFERFAELPGFMRMSLGERSDAPRSCMVNLSLVAHVTDLGNARGILLRDSMGRTQDLNTWTTLDEITGHLAGRSMPEAGPTIVIG